MLENIQNVAKQYAEQMLQKQLDAIAKAYIDGYNRAKGIVEDDNMSYVDLGLPSRILWATRFIGATEERPEGSRMVYADATKYNLPTEEQRAELHTLPFKCVDKNVIFYGINGNTLTLPMTGFIESGKTIGNRLSFWLKDSYVKDDDYHRMWVADDVCDTPPDKWLKQKITSVFMGSFLSVLTVKNR